MKTTLLKISMLMAVLMFAFAGTSWADSGKNWHGQKGSQKRIYSKPHGGKPDLRPTHYRQKDFRQRNFYHRNKWIQKHRQLYKPKWYKNHRPHYRPGQYYGDNAYDDDPASNEFSIAATVYEPGVEFSIGAKRTW